MAVVLNRYALQSPAELSEDDWLTVEEMLKEASAKSEAAFDPSALRRFARYWKARGSAVPQSIFAHSINTDSPRSNYSAASHFIWAHEWHEVCARVSQSSEDGSLEGDIAQAFLAVVWEAPQRAAETHYLRLEDLDDKLGLIVVTSSGFGHLKNDEFSRRPINLSVETTRRLASLRRRLRAVSPSRKYFFFLGNEPMTDPSFVTLTCEFAGALVVATGESDIRRHSLRGAAEMRSVIPDLENYILFLLDNLIALDNNSCISALSSIDQWRVIVRAAYSADHHSLTAISTYLTCLLFLARHQRLRILDTICPGSWIAGLGGMTAGNLRVAKHRTDSRREGYLPIWRRLLGRINLGAMASHSIALADATQSPQCPKEDLINVGKQCDPELLWCAALIGSGASPTLALDLSGHRDVSFAQTLSDRASQSQRWGGQCTSDSLRVMRAHGLAVATKLTRPADFARREPENALDVSVLNKVRDALRKMPRVEKTMDNEIVESLTALCKVVTVDWGIQLLPECGGISTSLQARLRRVRPKRHG